MTSWFDDHQQLSLAPEDRQLLDRLVDAGFDRSSLSDLPDSQQQRVDALFNLLGLVDDYPVEDDHSQTLMDATLARIDQHERQQAERMRFETAQQSASSRSPWRIRVPDFVTVAAVLLIGVGVCWPMLSSMRQRSIDSTCANNMRRVAYAFSQYAGDNNGSLPVAKAGAFNNSWDTFRNVLNLQPLVQGSYCEHGCLNCPGHPHGQGPSYSYRWFHASQQPSWGAARTTIVLGDLNPVLDPARAGRFLPPLSMSINHKGRGQNVLTSDGTIIWLQQPLVGRNDNIWLPEGTSKLRPGMQPHDASDVFLAH